MRPHAFPKMSIQRRFQLLDLWVIDRAAKDDRSRYPSAKKIVRQFGLLEGCEGSPPPFRKSRIRLVGQWLETGGCGLCLRPVRRMSEGFGRLISTVGMCIVQSSERGIPLLYNRVSCAWLLPGQGFPCLWRKGAWKSCGMLMRNLWVVVS